MSWGTKRRNTIITIFFLIVFSIVGYILFDLLYEPPNCFDKKMNGDEAGIDCGGYCDLFCKHQTLDPIVRWIRLFEVSSGIYNVLAYVENPNPTAGVETIKYRFRIFDENNALLQERDGKVKLLPKTIIPVLENSLVAGKLDATRVSFEFLEDLVWVRQEPDEPVIIVQDEEIANIMTEPRITALLKNIDIVPVDDVKVVAIVYDKEDNAIASASTILERIPPNGNAQAFFVWPDPFKKEISRFEIIPVYERKSY